MTWRPLRPWRGTGIDKKKKTCVTISPLSVYRYWHFSSLTASLEEPGCRTPLLANLLYSKWLSESGLLHYMWEAWVSGEPSIWSTPGRGSMLYLDRNASAGQSVFRWSMKDFQNNDRYSESPKSIIWITEPKIVDVSRPEQRSLQSKDKSKAPSTGKIKSLELNRFHI